MIVDSNLIILASKEEHGDVRAWLAAADVAVSAISRVEVLGFPHITPSEQAKLDAFFATFEIIPIADPVRDEAIRLKQLKKMSLGDSIVAGTAILHGGELAPATSKIFGTSPA